MNHIRTEDNVKIGTLPEPIDKDHRGTLIEEGLSVAYNHSGSVEVGTIVSIKRTFGKPQTAHSGVDTNGYT